MNERDLFLSALEIEDPAARKAHLQSACADNAELLSRVESLLASHEGESRFLQTPVVEQLGDDPIGQTDATLFMGTGSTHDESPGCGADASILEFSPNQERSKMADENTLGYFEPSTKPGSLGRLAHYEILEVVGQGAFGTVLRAFDDKLQRVVAIKVMAPELAATSPARKRFVREAQASAQIRHENVVSVYAVEEKPIPYLVMEYIPGLTLQQRLDEKGPLDVQTVLRLGTQIAEGLAAAHAKDLIHRDIKPGNILLESGMRDRVKITDFGLARAADDASMTQSGTIAGTPMYMAPEQALGHKLDKRADLFSFGSVLYQMVSGRPPFRAASTLAVLKRLTEDTPRPIREIIPETPTWLCDIIAKLHAKNPDERYQSAREIADVLANCEAQVKSHAGLKDYSLIPRAKAQPAEWWKWVAVAALVLPLLAITLYAFTRPGSQPKVAEKGTVEPSIPDPVKPVATAKSSPATVAVVPVTDGWVQLFNGKDLTGWTTHPERPGQWKVERGALVGSTIPSYLFSDGTYGNFHLRLEVKINQGGDSSVFLRVPFSLREGRTADQARPAAGYDVELQQNPAHVAKTGSVGDAETAGPPKLLWKNELASLTSADEWFTLEIIADGNRIISKVNGTQTADCRDPRSRYDAGHLALQVYSPQTIVQFRKIEIKELPASSSPSVAPPLAADVLKDAVLRMNFEKDTFYEKDGKTYVRDLSGKGNDGECDQVEYTPNGQMGGSLACKGGALRLPKLLLNKLPEYTIAAWINVDFSKETEFGLLVQGSFHDEKSQESVFVISLRPTNIFMNTWNDELDSPDKFKVCHLNFHALKPGWHFVAVRLRQGGVGTGELLVTRNDKTLKGDLQSLNASDRFRSYVGHRHKGNMDDLVIIPRALSDAELQAIYEQGLANNPMPPTFTNSLGMEFVIVPQGKSWLGGGKDKLGDKEVEIPADFYLGKYEVTQEEWAKVMGENPSFFSPMGAGKDRVNDIPDADLKRFPVESVTWDQCQIFVEKLNRLEKETGWVYRLPNDAEWEYACRGGAMADKLDSAFDFYFAKPTNTLLPEQANFNRVLDRTCKVGSYEPNPLGLFDMHGNVWEWCGDTQKATDGASLPIERGGGWTTPPQRWRAAMRMTGPLSGSNGRSLRLARVPAVAAFDTAQAKARLEAWEKQFKPTFNKVWPPETIAGFRNQVDQASTHHNNANRLLILLAYRNDAESHRAYGKKHLGQFPKFEDWGLHNKESVANLAGRSLRACLLLPVGEEELKPLAGLAERVRKSPDPRYAALQALGLLDYRAGRFADAARQYEESLRGIVIKSTEPWGEPLSAQVGFQLAMAQARSGNLAVARDAYQHAEQRMMSAADRIERDEKIELVFQDWVMAVVAWREALGVLGAPEAAAAPPTAAAPFTDADVQRIAALPAAEQVEGVRKELVRRNPGFDGTLTPTIENEVVTELSFNSDQVEDISPVRALKGLIYLDCRGTYPNKGKLSDLSPLKGMTTISHLDCSSTQISDLTPLAGLPLTNLQFNHNPVSDLTPLKKMPLDVLGCAETKVADFSPLKGMKLTSLGAQLLPVTDLSPLEGMPLTALDLYHTIGVTSLAPLKGMPLEGLNLQDVPVSDLSPLAGMTTLRTLLLQGTKVSDLSPLAGLKLTDLILRDKQITDLSPLKGMPLARLIIHGTGVTDLSPLQDMPLVEIRLTPQNITQGLDILKGIKSLQIMGIADVKAWPPADFWERYDKGEFKE